MTDIDDDLNDWLSQFQAAERRHQHQRFFARLEQITRGNCDALAEEDHLPSNDDIFDFDHFFREFAGYYGHVAAAETDAAPPEFLSAGSDISQLGLTTIESSCYVPSSTSAVDGRGEPVLDDLSPAAYRYLVYHFHAALSIYRRLRLVERQNRLLRGIIDSRTRAILVCDSQGSIVHHNHQAKSLLIRHACFRRQGNRLTLAREAEQRQFSDYLKQACGAAGSCGFWGLRVGAAPGFSVCLRPLSDVSRDDNPDGSLCLVIILADDCGCAPAEVASLFDLSAKEITVLNYLLKGLSLPEIAGELFITHNTVRSHVRSIFQKTRTGSQLELVSYVQQLAGSF